MKTLWATSDDLIRTPWRLPQNTKQLRTKGSPFDGLPFFLFELGQRLMGSTITGAQRLMGPALDGANLESQCIRCTVS